MLEQPAPDTCVAILCGGLSRRMGGRTKAALPLGDTTVLGQILATTAALDLPRLLVTGTGPVDADLAPLLAASGVAQTGDRYLDSGPLAGLHAAFAATAARRVLLLACDLPFLSLEFLLWLLEQNQEVGSVVPVDAKGRLHPLCAVYDANCRADMEKALESRQLRLQNFLRAIGARQMGPDSWANLDPHGQLLTNLNEPEEYEAARQWFASR